MNVVIDPKQVTKYNRTQGELELFWLFCIMVAGKNSDTVSKKLATMMKPAECSNMTPFEYLRWIDGREKEFGGIEGWLRHHKAGQYNRLCKAFKGSLTLNLRKCLLSDLLDIPGVGQKTARFFLLHTRKSTPYVILDTHILRWLRQWEKTAPKVTPQSAGQYELWSRIAYDYIEHYYPDKTMAEADLTIWKEMSGRA